MVKAGIVLSLLAAKRAVMCVLCMKYPKDMQCTSSPGVLICLQKKIVSTHDLPRDRAHLPCEGMIAPYNCKDLGLFSIAQSRN